MAVIQTNTFFCMKGKNYNYDCKKRGIREK